MTSKLLIAGVAAGCVAAAGLGGFLAVRTATHSSEAASIEAAPVAIEAPSPAAVPAPTVAPAAAPGIEATATVATARPAGPSPRATRPSAPREVPTTRVADSPLVDPPAPAPEEALPVLTVPTSQSVAMPVHPGRNIELPGPRYELVELPANAVIGIRLETAVSTDSARVEDPVYARVTRPVVVDGVTVIPTGARLSGLVTLVEPGGRFRERSRIGVRFTSVAIDEDRHVPIQTEAIYREGEPPTGEATAKIGASAVVGSILGGVFGGRKGAAIGAATGAAGGTAIVASGGPNEATLPSGATFTVRLSEPATFESPR